MLYNWVEVLLRFVYSLAFMALIPGVVNAASFQLNWIDNSQEEDGFHVERKLGTSGTFSVIVTTGPSATSYNDSTLTSNTMYCYRVNAFNSAGNSSYTNEACGTTSGSTSTPPPAGSNLTATLLGPTGEDIAGTITETPDGIKDDHIRLNGVQSAITAVKVTDGGGCCLWQSPYNGQGDWIVAIRPRTDPSVVDVYFDIWGPSFSSYTVNLTFANGTSQTVQTSAPVASAVQLPNNVATATVLSNTTANQSALAINSVTKIGVFRSGTGEWLLDRNGNGHGDGCAVDTCIRSFGQTGDLPLTRKINNLNETLIGIFHAGMWMFDSNGNNTLDNCSVDECNSFGISSDLPVIGDWNGSGTEGIGVYRPSTGEWFLDMNDNGQWDGCSLDRCFRAFGGDGEFPVVGDWNGSGRAGIGIFRPSTGEWFLDMNDNGLWDGCGVDKCFGPFGADGDLPIVGDWNGSGKPGVGVYRPSTGDWLLDINGNGRFDGCVVDACLGPLGQPGGLPVVGQW